MAKERADAALGDRYVEMKSCGSAVPACAAFRLLARFLFVCRCCCCCIGVFVCVYLSVFFVSMCFGRELHVVRCARSANARFFECFS